MPINKSALFIEKKVFLRPWQKLNTRLQKHRETNKLFRTLSAWVLIKETEKKGYVLHCRKVQSLLGLIVGLGPASPIQSYSEVRCTKCCIKYKIRKFTKNDYTLSIFGQKLGIAYVERGETHKSLRVMQCSSPYKKWVRNVAYNCKKKSKLY